MKFKRDGFVDHCRMRESAVTLMQDMGFVWLDDFGWITRDEADSVETERYVLITPCHGKRAGYARVISEGEDTIRVAFVSKVNESGVHLEDKTFKFFKGFALPVDLKEVEDAFF